MSNTKHKLTMGILAHVDSGKTTLTEALLYQSKMIQKLGRVDHGDAFLDTEDLEKQRGITIVSKQAVIDREDTQVTIIDTPGHMDFTGEVERAVRAMDLALFVVDATEESHAHTRQLFHLIRTYKVPTVIFVNKLDLVDADFAEIFENIRTELDAPLVNFLLPEEERDEEIGTLDEAAMEEFLEKGSLANATIHSMVRGRTLIPIFGGTALKQEGIEDVLDFIMGYAKYRDSVRGHELGYGEVDSKDSLPKGLSDSSDSEEFGAYVYRIARDKDVRITFAKVTSGSIKPRMEVDGEKINQIRRYSGGSFEQLTEAEAGDVVAFTGLTKTVAGQGIGIEEGEEENLVKPILRYVIELPEDVNVREFYPRLLTLADEDPLLEIGFNEKTEQIDISIMGALQLEILKTQIKTRFGVEVDFSEGEVIYKETVRYTTYGIGHFEPLRHYAEIHVLVEPLPEGSGIEIATDINSDELSASWLKIALNTMSFYKHRGVLTGSELTDVKITLAAGRSHTKHTNPGDIREATRRAIRAALMKNESVLLYPKAKFTCDLPSSSVGRFLTDIDSFGGKAEITSMGTGASLGAFGSGSLGAKSSGRNSGMTTVTGYCPFIKIRNYQATLNTYTSNEGSIFIESDGFMEVEENLALNIRGRIGYDPEADRRNPIYSVFVDHGSPLLVPYYEVEKYAHIESREGKYLYYEDWEEAEKAKEKKAFNSGRSAAAKEISIGLDEIDSILQKNGYSNSGSDKKGAWHTSNYRKFNGASGFEDYSDGYSGGASAGTLGGSLEGPGGETYNGQGTSAGSGSNGTGASHLPGEVKKAASAKRIKKKPAALKEILLVDGYNIIYAWEQLKIFTEDNMDGARYKLLDVMSNYQAMKDIEIIVVFDAYKVRGHVTEKMDYFNVHVVYTKEAETADLYIAKFAIEHAKERRVNIATSDNLVQLIIRGAGAGLMSARELEEEIRTTKENFNALHGVQ